MGYSMSQQDSSFFISVDDFSSAIAAIKELAKNTGNMTGGRHYSWTDMSYVKDNDLRTILQKWRWDVDFDANGNVNHICFDGEKIGDDFLLLSAMAPFVEDGSFIEMQGEDGLLWRWVFDNGQCREITAEIRWPKPKPKTQSLPTETDGLRAYLLAYQDAVDMDDDLMLHALCEVLEQNDMTHVVMESFPLSNEED